MDRIDLKMKCGFKKIIPISATGSRFMLLFVWRLSDIRLCWVGTASEAFLETISTPLKLGKKWVFVKILKWVLSGWKSGF